MKNILYKIAAVITLSLQFLTFQASATTAVLICDNCTTTQQRAVLDRHVQLERQLGTFVIIDTIKAISTEIILKSTNSPMGSSRIEYRSSSTATKPYLLNINASLKEIQAINVQLRKAQLEVIIPASSGFETAATVLLATDDFERFIANDINSAMANSALAEIRRRAQNQLELLRSNLSISLVRFSASLGTLVQDSSWVAKFSDGSKMTIDISFKYVSDKLAASVEADKKTAYSPDGISIPLSKYTMNGFQVNGSYGQVHSYGEWFAFLGTVSSYRVRNDELFCEVISTASSGDIESTAGGKTSFTFRCD